MKADLAIIPEIVLPERLNRSMFMTHNLHTICIRATGCCSEPTSCQFWLCNLVPPNGTGLAKEGVFSDLQ